MSRFLPLAVLVLFLAACKGPPVQEMSDARQAITAARNAGAAARAPADLKAAQAAIERAESHLQAREYTRARMAAIEAKHEATSALRSAERAGPPADPH